MKDAPSRCEYFGFYGTSEAVAYSRVRAKPDVVEEIEAVIHDWRLRMIKVRCADCKRVDRLRRGNQAAINVGS